MIFTKSLIKLMYALKYHQNVVTIIIQRDISAQNYAQSEVITRFCFRFYRESVSENVRFKQFFTY